MLLLSCKLASSYQAFIVMEESGATGDEIEATASEVEDAKDETRMIEAVFKTKK